MNNTVRQLVNAYFDCDICTSRTRCVYGEGTEGPMELESCCARFFECGIRAFVDYLATQPIDKTYKELIDIYNSNSDKD